MFIKPILGLIKIADNWLQILFNRFLGLPITEIRLRNGIKFVSYGIDRAEISMLVDIWHREVYTPPFLPIEPHDTVIDVGANKGYFTVLAASKARHGKVYAFEPVPDLAQRARENLKANSLSNVIIIDKALWKESGQQPLYISTNSGGHSMRPKPSSYSKIMVTAIRLDEFCAANQIKQVNFLKLDCEGAEYDILMTLDREFLGNIQKIAMETHDFGNHHHSQLREFLANNKFQIKEQKGYLYARRD